MKQSPRLTDKLHRRNKRLGFHCHLSEMRLFGLFVSPISFTLINSFTRDYPNENIVGFAYLTERDFIVASLSNWKIINVRLKKEDKPALEAFADSVENDVFHVIDEVLSQGYKLSISWVDAQNSYVVSVSGTDRAKYNKGCTITSWSDEVSEAIMMMGYKVLVLGEKKAWVDLDMPEENWG